VESELAIIGAVSFNGRHQASTSTCFKSPAFIVSAKIYYRAHAALLLNKAIDSNISFHSRFHCTHAVSPATLLLACPFSFAVHFKLIVFAAQMRPSVTFVYSVETNEHIFTIFFTMGYSDTFPHQTLWQYSDGASNAGGIG